MSEAGEDILIETAGVECLPEYGRVSIAYTVNEILAVEQRDRGLAGLALVRRRIAEPYVKDYDQLEGGPPAEWGRQFDLSNWGFLLAKRSGRTAGAAAVAWNTSGVNMLEGRRDLSVLWDIRVQPELRGSGIGARLLQAAADWSRRHGCRRMKIETQNVNMPACRFYARMGATLGDIRLHAYEGDPQVAHEVQLNWYLDLLSSSRKGGSMDKWKILVTDGLDEAGLEILRRAAEVEAAAGITAQDLAGRIAGFHGLIVRGRTRVSADLLRAAAQLRVVGRAGVGVDNIDLEACRKGGITVVNAPQATTTAVAELTLGLLLALARDSPRADALTKAGKWEKKSLEGVELSGKTLGLIGFGRIGSEVARRALAFGMHVLAYDPLLPAEEVHRRGADPVAFTTLLEQADFISLHLPLTADTRGLINASAFARMKPGVRLVCAARGGIIDEAALLAALDSGQAAGAALDVFSQEPVTNEALIRHPRLVLTPHIGAQTVEAQQRASADIAAEVLAALRGAELRWRVV